jgi:histidinol-phosphate aminotransferase
VIEARDSRNPPRAARGVSGLAPYQPGKPVSELERELGLHSIIKLASNENPLGPGAAARAALHAAVNEVGYYPDGSGHELKQALGAWHRMGANRITLGNGSNDILVLLAEAFLEPGDEAVYSQHCFAIYPIAVQAAGAIGRRAPALSADSDMPFGHDLDALAAQIGTRSKLVFIANPNNPTGTWLESGALRRFLAALPASTLAVLDEAYFDYAIEHGVADGAAWLDEFPNLVIVRTFSKVHGLAGLRVGYALSSPEVADLLNRVRQPFNVSSVGLAAAQAALGDREHVARSLAINREGLGVLRTGLAELRLSVPPSAGNFVLAGLGRDAGPVFDRLLRQGVIVRPVANYGLPQHLRITVGTPDQNRRLLAAMPKALG